MILNDNEVNTRLESPLNLLNRLNRVTSKSTGMELFKSSTSDDESLAVFDSASLTTDKIDELVEDSAKKIKLGIVKSRALNVLHDSLGEIERRIGEVEKVRDLATIAKTANDILAEDNKKQTIGQQVIVYKPIVNDIAKYETLVVNE
jgi:hypothetical protein